MTNANVTETFGGAERFRKLEALSKLISNSPSFSYLQFSNDLVGFKLHSRMREWLWYPSNNRPKDFLLPLSTNFHSPYLSCVNLLKPEFPIVRQVFVGLAGFDARGTTTVFYDADYITEFESFDAFVNTTPKQIELHSQKIELASTYVVNKNREISIRSGSTDVTKGLYTREVEKNILCLLAARSAYLSGDYVTATNQYQKVIKFDSSIMDLSSPISGYVMRDGKYEYSRVDSDSEWYLKSLIFEMHSGVRISDQSPLYQRLDKKMVDYVNKLADGTEKFDLVTDAVWNLKFYYGYSVLNTPEYEGKKLSEVLEVNPDYIMNCIITLEDFAIDCTLLANTEFLTAANYLVAVECNLQKSLFFNKWYRKLTELQNLDNLASRAPLFFEQYEENDEDYHNDNDAFLYGFEGDEDAWAHYNQ